MNEDNVFYGEGMTIEVWDLFATFLRHWKLYLIAALIGAALLGGYQFACNYSAEPGLVMSDEELEEAKQTITDNENAISNNETELASLYIDLENLYDAQENYTAAMEKALSVEEVDTGLVTDIMELAEKLESTQSSITSKTNRITELDNQNVALQEENTTLEAQMTEAVSTSLTKGVARNVIIGVIIGILLAFIYLFVKYLTDKRLHTEASLEDAFGLYLLQAICLPADNGKKRGRYARFLDKLSGAASPEQLEQQYEIAAAKISALAKGGNRVMLTGSAREELVANVYEGLIRHLADSDLELVMVEDLEKHPEALSQMPSYQIVLVEGVMDSRMDAICETLKFIRISGANMIGAIAVRKLQ